MDITVANNDLQCTENTRNSEQTIHREAISDAITEAKVKNTFSEAQTTTPSAMTESECCTVFWHELNQTPKCSLPLPTLKPDNNIFLYIKVPLQKNRIPKPYPAKYKDICDTRCHVMMPCSAQNEETSEQYWLLSRWLSTSVSKWKIIRNTLSQKKFKSPQDLVDAISCGVFMKAVNFNSLLSVLDEYSHQKSFFDEFVPQLIKLTLSLPSIVTKSVNLLKHGLNATIFLSQQQIACLLANAFFCTYPKRLVASVEYYDYPSINFLSLFTNDNQYEKQKIQKLKCILNYFQRVIKDMPKGVVSFERRCLEAEEVPNWSQSSKKLCKLNVCSEGLIERDGTGLLQVDFADMFVGGGVFESQCCAQEEIRFVISPELIISRLFTEKLDKNEVLIVKGCEQFNDYSGYEKSFQWKHDFVDKTPRDEWGRRYTTVVAMDALFFNSRSNNRQYEIKLVKRELNKAYCGFYERLDCDAINKCGIASGNWGCGAFNGDPQLKAIIQLMAASQADRDLLLFTFNDVVLKSTLQRFYQFVVSNEFTVSRLYRALNNYDKYVTQSKSIKLQLGVIDYIMKFEDKDFDTKT